MKLLIICNPEEGNATELCLFLKSEAEKMNRRVTLLNAADDSKAPLGFDAVIVAASINESHFGAIIETYVKKHSTELNSVPWFFLAAYDCFEESDLKVPEVAEKITRELLKQLNLTPQQQRYIGVGTRLEHNRYKTHTDWGTLKMALQQFVIKNDLMMA